MKIISRNIRSHEEKAVVDNEEKKEVTKPVDAEEVVKVREATMAVEVREASGATEIKEAPGAMEAAETTEAVGAIEAAETTEVTDTTKVVEVTAAPEVTEAEEVEEVAGEAQVSESAEATETIGRKEVGNSAEATEVSEAEADLETVAGVADVTEEVDAVAGTTEIKEVSDTVEVTGTTEAVEVKAAPEVTGVAETTEVIEPTETEPVDYEALGLRSVELNPNDYPDEVIALLGPYKDDKNNNSVLFYSSLGLAYKSKGRLKVAIAAYKRALELVPNVPAPSIQYNLGITYYYNDELHKSLSCFLNSSAQRSDHPGTEKWIKHIADELDIYKAPNTSKLKLVINQKISVNRKKDDRESRIRIYLTQNGGRIQELSVKDKIYAYGIDSDTVRPVDYVIIDNDGDGSFDDVINTKGKFGVPTWAYNPD